MAKKPVAKSSSTVLEMVEVFQKDMGERTATIGGFLVDSERIPTGIYEFDLATGGGFPRGKVSIIYGKESSNKTNLALKAIAHNQLLRPHEVNVFIDVENEFNAAWATAMGVNVKKLVVIKPDFAEQVVDVVEGLLGADDIGLIVIDSLAAMLSTQEMNSSADKAVVGGTGLVIGKLYRKVTHAMIGASKEDRFPTVIYINQLRMKVGIVFGNPETMPGGFGPLYQSALTVRCHGTNVKNPKNSELFLGKEVTFQIQKSKVPVLATMGKYTMFTVKYNGFSPGDCDDWGTVQGDLEAIGGAEKTKKGYSMLGVEYPTQKAAREKYENDKAFGNEVRQALIEAHLASLYDAENMEISIDEELDPSEEGEDQEGEE